MQPWRFHLRISLTPFSALAWGLVLLTPHAHAADLGGAGIWSLLNMIWAMIGTLGGLAMLSAGFLFFRMRKYQAVLICLAIQTVPGVLTRALMFLYQQNSDAFGTWILAGLNVVSGGMTVVQWGTLGVAAFVTLVGKPSSAD